MPTIGQRIKQLRVERDYTQEQLANLLNIKISKSAIGMYELDNREPDKETLEAIADFFNVDMDYLYGKSDYRNKHEWLNSLNQESENISTVEEFTEQKQKFVDDVLQLDDSEIQRVHDIVKYVLSQRNEDSGEK